MSVWNRPMFAGARPPNSARAELERLRVGMDVGGSPLDRMTEQFPTFFETPPPRELTEDVAPAQFERQEARIRQQAERAQQQLAREVGRLGELSPYMSDKEIADFGYADRGEIAGQAAFFGGNPQKVIDFFVAHPAAMDVVEQRIARRPGDADPEMVKGLRSLMAAVRGEHLEQRRAGDEPPSTERAVAGDSPFRDLDERRDPPPLEGRAAFKDARQRQDFDDAPPPDEPTPPPDAPPPFDPRFQPFGMDQAEMADFLRDRYTAREALYDEILGDPDRRRAQARSEIFFEIAQRALQFAGGVGPDGRPMSGSMFAQAAQSFAPVFGSLAERSRELTDQERALRASRLDAAEGDLAREQGLRAEITGAQVRSLIEAAGVGAPPQPLTLEALLPTQEEIDQHVPDLPDIRLAYDAGSPFRNMANTAGAIIGMQFAPETGRAVVASQFINNRLLGRLARTLQQVGRPSNFTLELSQRLLDDPAQFRTSVAKAQNGFTQIRQAIEIDLNDEIERFNTALEFGDNRAAMEAYNAIRGLRVSHMEVSAMLDSLGGRRPTAGGQRDIDALSNLLDED